MVFTKETTETLMGVALDLKVMLGRNDDMTILSLPVHESTEYLLLVYTYFDFSNQNVIFCICIL